MGSRYRDFFIDHQISFDQMQIADLYAYFLQHMRVTTDTRNLQAGDMFFALKGEKFDGNQFAAKALEKGARTAVVDDPTVVVSDQYILVDDVLTQLQELALYHRRQMDAPVIAVTGSNGKTTTKELLFAVLKKRYKAFATQGNFNNHIGLPLTLLSIPASAEVLVIEMGANHQGEIADLCRIAEPTHGLITNIGRAHLEGFGGLEGVKRGKGELFEWLQHHDGVAFINADEKHLSAMASQQPHPIFYGSQASPPLHFRIEMIQAHPYVSTRFWTEDGDTIVIDSQLPGAFNFANIATAVALGAYFKVPEKAIQQAIKHYRSDNSRSQILEKNNVRFLLDAYNANEDSTEASLRSFAAMQGSRKVVMLGAMLELGAESPAAHQRIAELAKTLDFEKIILVGPEYQPAAQLLGIQHFMDSASLRQWYDQQDWQSCFILLKGSRSMQMERVVA